MGKKLGTLLEMSWITYKKKHPCTKKQFAHIKDLVDKIKESNVYALLSDDVTDTLNIYQLVYFVKIFDVDKGKAETAFLDCSDLLEHSPDASPYADAIEESRRNLKNLLWK